MLQVRIFTQSNPDPMALTFDETERPQIEIQLTDGTRITLSRFADGRAEIMVNGLQGDEIHIRPRSNVFDVIATSVSALREQDPNYE
ncbi:MAG: hypothetical protein HGA19_01210 [Oscillochloris sp.]|nr:hypothetical protein [Oscillochloris sp.]